MKDRLKNQRRWLEKIIPATLMVRIGDRPILQNDIRKTVTVVLTGRLGNQLFQYACGYALAKRNGLSLRMDRLGQLKHFNIQASQTSVVWLLLDRGKRLTRILCKIHFLSSLVENRSMDFEPRLLKPQRTSLWVYGYWQDERYFADCASDIRAHFQITTPLSLMQTRQLLNEIVRCCAVSIHVRRKDYVGSDVYTQLTPQYYQKACEYIAKRCGLKPTFYVFSDDPAWVAQHFLPQFVPRWDMRQASSPDISEIDDLRAMSACRHHIIANSSFSWWGAWLNPSVDKLVISPRRWFNADSYLNELTLPSGWVRI